LFQAFPPPIEITLHVDNVLVQQLNIILKELAVYLELKDYRT